MKISILLPDLRGGGAERLHVNLANEWVRRGNEVEFALMSKRGELLQLLASDILVFDLKLARIRSLLPSLLRHLRRSRPDVIVAAMWPLTSVAVIAWCLAGRPGKLFISDHSHVSSSLRSVTARWLARSLMWGTYGQASGIIAVSASVRRDLCALGCLDPSSVRVIHNPAALGRTFPRGTTDDRHRLWGPGNTRNILSVGALKPDKDHETLIRSIALIAPALDVRLTILGEGSLRPKLEELVRTLGLEGKISLPGFVLDPYPWYLTADVFVLSSRSEGFGNVLIEALECGVPVVSTDSGGPTEILENGAYGRLVPIENPEALAEAVRCSLLESHNAKKLCRRAANFSVDAISEQYLKYFESQP